MYWLSVAGVTPAAAAFAWSTTIVADGRPSLRLEVTSASPSTVFTSARTMSLASLSTGRVAGGDADLHERHAAHARRGVVAGHVMVPAFWSSATPARTSSMMAFLSASGSVVIANVAWLDEALVPPPAPNRLPVLPPVTW